MHLYHGSPLRLGELQPPSQTGNFRPGEENREEFSDVIFLTSDRDMALKYAGPSGYLYACEVDSPANYAEAVAADAAKRKKLTRKKLASLRADVFVAPATAVKIKARFAICKAGRNSTAYVVEC